MLLTIYHIQLTLNYAIRACLIVRLNMSMTSTGVLFNPIFHLIFLFKTHIAKTNLLIISVKHDKKLASQCT